MEWQWYHYVACIAFGVIMKMVRNALGLTPRRATSVYLLRSIIARALHAAAVVEN
jgi:hypothetical protein